MSIEYRIPGLRYERYDGLFAMYFKPNGDVRGNDIHAQHEIGRIHHNSIKELHDLIAQQAQQISDLSARIAKLEPPE